MRSLVFVALLGLFGCNHPTTTGGAASPPMAPQRAGLTPVSGPDGGEALSSPPNQSGVVRKPVAGGGEVAGSAVVWEYDTVTLQQLTGLIRSGRDDAVQQALRSALNEWGAQGWELVMVSGETYIFKRPAAGF